MACLFFCGLVTPSKAQIVTPDSQAVSYDNNDFTQIVKRPDESLLIFELKIGNAVLSDAMLTFEDYEEDYYYIPFIDFLDAVEFPISVNYETGEADGWFISDDNSFALSLADGTVTIRGQDMPLDVTDVEKHEDSIYVALHALEKWFPMTLDVDYSTLAIQVKSLRPLPIELKIARDYARGNLSDDEDFERKQNPLEKPKAGLFTLPFLDFNLQSSYNNAESVQQTVEHRFSIIGRSIALGQDAEYSVNDTIGDEDKPDIRLTLGRQAFQGEKLVAGITQYQVGDVFTTEMPLIARSNAGRGAYITNTPVSREFLNGSNNITLRGDLPVGFQVDIKQNGELLDFIEEADENGEYIFDDLTVFPGINVFELVFYGPQGQQRTEERRIFIPNNTVEEGQFEYRVQAIQDDTNLFTDRDSSDEDVGQNRFLGEVQYGLTKTSSVRASYARYSLDGEVQNFGLLGGSTSWKGLRLDFNQAIHKAGQATSGLIQTVFKGFRLQAQHKYYSNFLSEENETTSISGDLQHETNVRASGMLPFLFLKRMPLTLQAQRLVNTDGESEFDWSFRATRNFDKIRLTTELNQLIPASGETETTLNTQISTRFRDFSLRGAAIYDIEPVSELQSIRLTSDITLDEKSKLRLGLSRAGADDPVDTFTLGINRDIGRMVIGLNTSYDSEDNMVATLGASFGLNYDHVKKKPYMSAKRFAESSALIAKAYKDDNADGQKSDDEDYLEGVGFVVAGSKESHITNADGEAYIPRLKAFDRSTIEVNTSSLPNPFMKSPRGKVDFLMRPSQVHTASFPVRLSGEIDGNISIFRPDAKRPASSIILEVNQGDADEVIASERSEFDGFFLISDVPMGPLSIQPSADQIADLGYCPVAKQKLLMQEEEPFVTVPEEIVLFPDPEEVTSNQWLVLSHAMNFESAMAIKDDFAAIEKKPAGTLPFYVWKDRDDYKVISGPYEDLPAQKLCDGFETCKAIVMLSCELLNDLQCVKDDYSYSEDNKCPPATY